MNTSMPEDGKLAKVRALLAKAEDPATTPEEAQSYFAKAAELMAKYGIERAMLADSDPNLDRPGDRIITIKGVYEKDRRILFRYIAMAFNCRCVTLKKGKDGSEVHLFGYESDLDRTEILFTSLLLQMFNGVRNARPTYGESAVTYRKSWLAGFILRINERLLEIEARTRQEASPAASGRSAELVVADRQAVVQARFTSAYPKIRSRGRLARGVSGAGEGRAAANRADLGQTRVVGRRALSA
ncbi:DUF2786 domain-containing protein [Streptomyces sp. NPDC003691]